MKRFTKFTAALLIVAMAAVSMAFAPGSNQYIQSYEGMEQNPSYISFTGTVTNIYETAWEDTMISVENEEGNVMNFIKDHLTHLMGGELEVGATVTGFYYAYGIAPMIYPPQHLMRVIAVDMEASIVVDRFEVLEGFDGSRDSFLSHSNQLILNISDDTPIYLADGQNVREIVAEEDAYFTTVADFINNRLLVVTHTLANFMMPAGTIPADPTLTVTVLFEQAVHLPGFGLDLDGGFDLGFDADFEDGIDWVYNYGISVNGRMVDALWQYVDGAYYVPFRAVVNLLGFGATVDWDDASRSITVFNGTSTIYITISSSDFRVANETVTLNHPAIIIDDRTYVPFQFFSYVFGMNNAWMSGGQVFIGNEEVME